jgi:TRAP-type C4-dicarboxylate transport system substrate-binding protein
MIRHFFANLCAAAMLAAVPLTAHAAESITLKFANPGAPQGDVSTQIIQPWVAKVNDEAAGSFRVQLFSGPALGQFPQIYDRVLNNVADIAFALLGPLSRQFPKTSVASLPFETPNAAVGTVALWHVYERGLLGDEWSQVKPLTLMVFPNVVVHTKKPVKTLKDVEGLKLSVQSQLLSATIHQLGAAPITLAVTDLYESLNRGVIDGAVIGWPATRSYRLAEVTDYHLEAPLGSEVTFIMMNKKSYDKLGDKDRAIIDKESGAPWATAIGKILDDDDRAEAERVGKAPGETVTQLPAAEQPEWKARIRDVVDEWTKRTPNGAAVLAAYREEIAKLTK